MIFFLAFLGNYFSNIKITDRRLLTFAIDVKERLILAYTSHQYDADIDAFEVEIDNEAI